MVENRRSSANEIVLIVPKVNYWMDEGLVSKALDD